MTTSDYTLCIDSRVNWNVNIVLTTVPSPILPSRVIEAVEKSTQDQASEAQGHSNTVRDSEWAEDGEMMRTSRTRGGWQGCVKWPTAWELLTVIHSISAALAHISETNIKARLVMLSKLLASWSYTSAWGISHLWVLTSLWLISLSPELHATQTCGRSTVSLSPPW